MNNDWKIEDDGEEEYIDQFVYRIGDEYIVKNEIDGEEVIFARFDDMIEAIDFRNLCVRNNWKLEE